MQLWRAQRSFSFLQRPTPIPRFPLSLPFVQRYPINSQASGLPRFATIRSSLVRPQTTTNCRDEVTNKVLGPLINRLAPLKCLAFSSTPRPLLVSKIYRRSMATHKASGTDVQLLPPPPKHTHTQKLGKPIIAYAVHCNLCSWPSSLSLSLSGVCGLLTCIHSTQFKASGTPEESGSKHPAVPNLAEFPPERIRNFCIISHIDHGKTTMSTRIMELGGTSFFNIFLTHHCVCCSWIKF